jgi:hypothetical protein
VRKHKSSAHHISHHTGTTNAKCRALLSQADQPTKTITYIHTLWRRKEVLDQLRRQTPGRKWQSLFYDSAARDTSIISTSMSGHGRRLQQRHSRAGPRTRSGECCQCQYQYHSNSSSSSITSSCSYKIRLPTSTAPGHLSQRTVEKDDMHRNTSILRASYSET